MGRGRIEPATLALREAATGLGGTRRVSNGLTAAAPITIVGYSQAFYVAETPNGPIQLRAVEPAIGGTEVGVIGSFASAVADPAGLVKLT